MRSIVKFLLLALLLVPCLFAGERRSYGANQAGPTKTVAIYIFWATGCPHCLHEKQFLAKLASQDANIQIVSLEVTASRAHRELLAKVGEALHADVSGVPFTVIGNRYLVGWIDDATSGPEITKAIQYARDHEVPDVVAQFLPAPPVLPPPGPAPAVPEKLTVPLLGEIEVKYFSVAALTIIIGLLDGFNPCAMWVLVFLINLLLGMADRKKMWLLGGTFILASGAVYFLIMTAWLNLLVFLGLIVWVRIGIGLVALAAGYYNLKEYLTNKAGVCKLANGARRQRRMARLQEIVQTRKLLLALGGIILLAAAVNLVEVICSAGFPVVYLQILSLTPMPFWQYYLYLLLYIFMYMLDDMVVFIVAMITLQLLGAGQKYKQASNLIGGVLMLIIGVLLIFKPEYLMFG